MSAKARGINLILARYLWRELGNVALATTIVLLLILVSIMLVRYLHIADSFMIAIKISALRLPYYLGMLMPVGFFFAVLLALGRFFAESEMVILFSSGMSWWHLVRLLLLPMGVVMAIVGLITTFVSPALERVQAEIMQQYRQQAASAIVQPGLIRFNHGQNVVYLKNVTAGGQEISEVEAILRNNDGSESIYVAPRASQYYNAAGDRYIRLFAGQRYDVKDGVVSASIRFKEYTALIQKHGIIGTDRDVGTLSMRKLLVNGSSEALAEFEWRIAIPLAVLVLGLLAIPLSNVGPRQGRYGRLFPAVLVFAVYFNILAIIRNEVESGDLSMGLGLFVAPLIFSVMGLLFIHYRNQGGRWRMKS
ncbi:LPS export ABC transporter permease LptF [Piscirickettsia salmonis]|uniref:LPS export ABC transporter permease LptF n=1 Tax=Piscirickettsia salmonis TaxID=1238 RepID=UPI001E5E1E3C|nr:LPS export ABC transporter permease LptF [Piscirickettsia salmonis]